MNRMEQWIPETRQGGHDNAWTQDKHRIECIIHAFNI